jgi:LPS O-antigen subunit length determinant protein (WzzB/FepE family)
MSPFDQFIYWASKNLIIVIPVAIAIVMILIALATACIRIRRKPQEVKAPASPVFASPNTYNPTNYNQGYVTEFPMQPMNAQQSAYNQRISRVQQYPTYQQSYAPPGSYL